ncbi:CPBP family intramembrane glutamic endopeptidase [uncultured Lactobacillus sp.]|uniref:CPBP family intramembrane glutamic endopeptidase n=1 Tax=uncultured Lactobacillus sp. TaxID=153152 RepID=UPI00262EE4ED|nr:CPBP family intramembrane glutamic endopeptidase [uncultured Lactobacillus sp.]
MKKVFQAQLYLNILMAVIILINYHTVKDWIYLGILAVAVVVSKNKRILQLINTVLIPMVFIDQVRNLSGIFIQHFSNLTVPIFWIYAIGTIMVLIPLTIVEYGKIKKPIWRLIASVWMINFIIMCCRSLTLKNVNPDGFLMSLNKSGLIYALTILVYVYFAVKSWGYEFYFNLPTFKGKKLQLLLFILIFGLAIWISFFKVFSEFAQKWQELFWNWDFSLLDPTEPVFLKNAWSVYLYSIEAGIGEEAARYINLVLLLVIFKSKKWQINGAVLGSAILFALPHIGNAFASELKQTPLATAFQVIDTFGFGYFAAVLILYSGKLWPTMIIHTLYDILVFSETPLTQDSVGIFCGNTGQFTHVIISLVLWVSFAIFILIKNRKLIKQNVQILTKVQKTNLTIS